MELEFLETVEDLFAPGPWTTAARVKREWFKVSAIPCSLEWVKENSRILTGMLAVLLVMRNHVRLTSNDTMRAETELSVRSKDQPSAVSTGMSRRTSLSLSESDIHQGSETEVT